MLLLLAAPLLAAPLAARQVPIAGHQRIEGRVVKQGVGQPGAEVILHRVSRDTAGVVDTARSDAAGAFSFLLPPSDPARFAVHFTTVDYLGVRHFGPALNAGEEIGEYVIEVFDTVAAASLQDSVRIARREIMVSPDTESGAEVNEVILLHNVARRTLVSHDGLPTWEFRIPQGVTSFEMGEGEIASDELRRMHDRIFVHSPLPPGTREVFLRYRLPVGVATYDVPAAQPTDLVNVFVQQPAQVVEATGLRMLEPIAADGRSFLHYSAAAVAPGSALRVSWRAAERRRVSPAFAVVAVVLLLLAIGAAVGMRRDNAAA